MIERKPDIIETDLDHELILLDPASQEMFSLNRTGRTLWRALPRSDAGALADVLVATHGADPAAALADAAAWLDTMRDTGLLLESGDGPST